MLTMVILSTVVLLIVASVIVTDQQMAQIDQQQDISGNIEQGADELNNIPAQYFLYQQSQELEMWQSSMASISDNLSNLDSATMEQQTLIHNAREYLLQLNGSFNGIVQILETTPENASIREMPEFQNAWTQMTTMQHALASDASQLSESLRAQGDQLAQRNMVLIISLLGIFGVFLLSVYIITYRHTLKSISNLQAGVQIIGSGNLEYAVSADRTDEIGELSNSFNQMTANLKTVTAYARNLIETSLDPLVTISAEGKITDVNSATEQVTGFSREDLIGSDFSDYFTEPEKAQVGYKRVFSEGFVRDYPLAIKHRSGKITDVLYNAVVYRNKVGDVQGVFAAARDITELRKAEEQARESERKLKDAERLAAIGATAGMVGHDIRNPLQSIIGEVYLADSELATFPDSEGKANIKESFEMIKQNTEYINKIVLDLQDFAKPIKPVTEEVEIEDIVKGILFKNGVPDNVNASCRVEEDAKKLITDPNLLKRVLTNLVINAVQAMPEGGRLDVHAFKEADDTIITVEDSGAGIAEEVRPKLFTPLFTMKSKGQGFGLAVVKRMTEALGGSVTFESEVGKGTMFIVRLSYKK
jgi:PAS domain S-box-containing protein